MLSGEFLEYLVPPEWAEAMRTLGCKRHHVALVVHPQEGRGLSHHDEHLADEPLGQAAYVRQGPDLVQQVLDAEPYGLDVSGLGERRVAKLATEERDG